MSDFKEYIPLEEEYNIQAAVENLRTAYWSNDTKKIAPYFKKAEDIIISAICHGDYTVRKAEITEEEAIIKLHESGWLIEHDKELTTRPQGECKTCVHRDPEDKKCDCGALERAGCPFPVSDDYFCKFYEKGGAENDCI